MKKLLLPFVFLALCIPSYAQTYTVERVIDGDTIVVNTPEGESEVVNLVGIKVPKNLHDYDVKRPNIHNQDPEMSTKMGQKMIDSVKGLLPKGSEVRLEYDVQAKDEYGRKLAYVWRIKKYSMDFLSVVRWKSDPLRKSWKSDKDFGWYLYLVNGELIRAGYASLLTIPPNVKYADLFQKLYEEAREKGRGLWRDEARQKNTLKKIKKLCESTGGYFMNCEVAFAMACEHPMVVEGENVICSCYEDKTWHIDKGCQ